MQEGAKEAFCLLLWRATGGTFDSRMRPLIEQGDGYVHYPRGYCTRPYDCFECVLMQQELSMHPDDEKMWVCPTCVSEVVKLARIAGARCDLVGHYTEGFCQFPSCTRPAVVIGELEQPERFSRFLQLIIGPVLK